MPRHFKVSWEGQSFAARAGDLLLDAALRSGVDMRHDCRVGHCGTCSVNVRHGFTLGGATGEPGCIRACQARIFSDLELVPNPAPEPISVRGSVAELRSVSHNVYEVALDLRDPLDWLPGQYCNVRFRGYPARSFSPTANMQTGAFDNYLRFHIRQVRGGCVTPNLGNSIAVGHKVTVEGPFGAAYHRTGRTERLILVGSGTGCAPIWAVFCAAIAENPARHIVLICGAREPRDFYMMKALHHASKFGAVRILPMFDRLPAARMGPIMRGTPADGLPELTTDDLVYAAGAPRLVEAVAARASEAGAVFFADPFEAGAAGSANGIVGGLKQLATSVPTMFRRAS